MINMSLIVTAIVTIILGEILGFYVSGFFSALFFALILGLVNFFLGNLLKFGGCLLNIFTFGIFNFLVNVGMIMLTSNMISGVDVGGFMNAAILSIALAIVNSMLQEKQLRR